jgi:hypothetical protein
MAMAVLARNGRAAAYALYSAVERAAVGMRTLSEDGKASFLGISDARAKSTIRILGLKSSMRVDPAQDVARTLDAKSMAKRFDPKVGTRSAAKEAALLIRSQSIRMDEGTCRRR